MPDDIWYAGAFISSGMVRATFGLFGLYAAYFRQDIRRVYIRKIPLQSV